MGEEQLCPAQRRLKMIRPDLTTYLTLNIMCIDTPPELHAESGIRADAGGFRRP